MNINPNAIAVMWALSMLMAGAIALGGLPIDIVAGLIVVFTIYAIL